jgi:hypothetical protein
MHCNDDNIGRGNRLRRRTSGGLHRQIQKILPNEIISVSGTGDLTWQQA